MAFECSFQISVIFTKCSFLNFQWLSFKCIFNLSVVATFECALECTLAAVQPALASVEWPGTTLARATCIYNKILE